MRLGLAICLIACSPSMTPVELVEPAPGSVHGSGPIEVVARPAPRIEVAPPLVDRPSRATLEVAVTVTDAHRVRTVEAAGVPLTREQNMIFCGNSAPSELPPDDDSVWRGRLAVGDAVSIEIVARDVLGHVSRIDSPVFHSMVKFAVEAPIHAHLSADSTSVLVLPGHREVLALDAEHGHMKARFVGEAVDAVWAEEDGLVARQRLPDGRHVLQLANADAPWDLPGDVVAATVVSGRVVAVGLDSDGPYLARHPALPRLRLPDVPRTLTSQGDDLVALRYDHFEEWRDVRGDVRATSMTPTSPAERTSPAEPAGRVDCLPDATRTVLRAGGTLAVSASRALSRYCPDDGRPPFDEPLPFITRVDDVVPVSEGLILLGTDASGDGRLVMLRP